MDYVLVYSISIHPVSNNWFVTVRQMNTLSVIKIQQ